MSGIKKLPANPFALFFVRSGVLAVVALLCTITFWYCTSVYFDQNQAMQEVLDCATKVLHGSNTTHWLDRGTLLGATRNQKFVVWEGEVTLGALANVSGALYSVMSEVSTQCNLHMEMPQQYLKAQAEQARAKADELAGVVAHTVTENTEKMSEVAWYLYNAHVGLRVLEWTPAGPADVAGSALQSATAAATAAQAAAGALGAAMISHGQELMHTLDTFVPPRPCEIHALADIFCPRDGATVLESHFGTEWFTAPLMSLFQ